MSSIYRKGEVLGWGSVAVVYRGWDELLERSVAIKELKQPFAGSEPFSRAFRSQALKMLDLSCRYLMATHAVDAGTGVQTVVREIADETVAQRSFQGPMEPEAVFRLLRQILAGLDAMHSRGLVHGAVKPENIFVCREDFKIGDFGLPVVEGTPPLPLSRHRYSSPEELLEPERVDRGADVYSLGVVVYELILGPLRLEQIVEELIREAGLGGPPGSRPGDRDEIWPRFHGSAIDLPPIHELEPAVPASLSLTLQKMVCKNLASRFANCKKVLASLGAAAPMELPSGSQRIVLSELGLPTQTVLVPVAQSAPRRPPPWLWAGVGTLAVTVSVAAGVWTLSARGTAKPVATPVDPPVQQAVSPQPQQSPNGTLADRLLKLRSPEGGLTVSLEPAGNGEPPQVVVGSPLRFRVESSRPGHLLLFALDSSGAIACLYPLAAQPEEPLPAGAPWVFPSEPVSTLAAEEPLGRELVFALVSAQPLPDLSALSKKDAIASYTPGANAQAFVAWVERLRRADREGTRLAALDFEIGAAPRADGAEPGAGFKSRR